MKRHNCPTCGALVLFAMATGEFDMRKLIYEWVDGLELEGKARSYLRKLRQRARDHILPFFKGYDVRALRAYQVKAFYRVLLKKKLASKTVKHILDALRAFLNALQEDEVIEHVPRFPRVRVKPTRERRWIDEFTQAQVISQVPVEHRLLVRCLVETGARPGEVCALRARDLRDGGVYVERAFDERGFVKSTKTGHTYFFPLSDDLFSELKAHVRRSFPDAWLFRYQGERYTQKELYRICTKAARAVGVKLPPSQLSRHSKASRRRAELEADMNEQLRAALNHESAATTRKHYALPGEARIELAAE